MARVFRVSALEFTELLLIVDPFTLTPLTESITGYTRFDMSILGLDDHPTDKPDCDPTIKSTPLEDKVAIDTIRSLGLKWYDYAPIHANCRHYANLFVALGVDLAPGDEALIWTPIISHTPRDVNKPVAKCPAIPYVIPTGY